MIKIVRCASCWWDPSALLDATTQSLETSAARHAVNSQGDLIKTQIPGSFELIGS